MRTGRRTLYTALTDLCLLACKSVCAKRGFEWMDDRSSESALLQITAVYPSALYTVVGRRASAVRGWRAAENWRLLALAGRAYLRAKANGGSSKPEYHHHDRSRKATTAASNAKVTDVFGNDNTMKKKKQKTMKQTKLKMENPSRAMLQEESDWTIDRRGRTVRFRRLRTRVDGEKAEKVGFAGA